MTGGTEGNSSVERYFQTYNINRNIMLKKSHVNDLDSKMEGKGQIQSLSYECLRHIPGE